MHGQPSIKITKLVVTLRNFANVSNNEQFHVF